MITNSGLAVNFASTGVTTMKRNASGITGIKLEPSDEVHSIYCTTSDTIVHENTSYAITSITGKRGSKGKPLG